MHRKGCLFVLFNNVCKYLPLILINSTSYCDSQLFNNNKVDINIIDLNLFNVFLCTHHVKCFHIK